MEERNPYTKKESESDSPKKSDANSFLLEEEKNSTNRPQENEKMHVLAEKKETQAKREEGSQIEGTPSKVEVQNEVRTDEAPKNQKENVDAFEDFL